MSLSDDIMAALPGLREEAESMMLATCTVSRPTGNTVTDPDTWQDVPETNPVAVKGVCKIQAATPQALRPEGGESKLTVERLQVHLPVGDPVSDGDLVTILSDPVDPSNDGLVFRLSELGRGTFRTAQRWDVEHVT